MGASVGQTARRSLTVDAAMLEAYAQITGDRNPLHFDETFAARTRFGRLIAQGGLATMRFPFYSGANADNVAVVAFIRSLQQLNTATTPTGIATNTTIIASSIARNSQSRLVSRTPARASR